MRRMIVMRNKESLVDGLKEFIDHIGGEDLVLVEIGSYQGESTEIFADSGHYSKIYCVDPWKNGYDDDVSRKQKASYACSMKIVENAFDKRMDRFDIIEKIKKTSVEAAKDFEDDSVDVAYIDGDHRYEAVLADIYAWLPKVKSGCFLTGHDYSDKIKPNKPLKNSVKRALEDTIGLPYKVFPDTSWVYRKP